MLKTHAVTFVMQLTILNLQFFKKPIINVSYIIIMLDRKN